MKKSLLGGKSGNNQNQDAIVIVELKHEGGSGDVVSSCRIVAKWDLWMN